MNHRQSLKFGRCVFEAVRWSCELKKRKHQFYESLNLCSYCSRRQIYKVISYTRFHFVFVPLFRNNLYIVIILFVCLTVPPSVRPSRNRTVRYDSSRDCQLTIYYYALLFCDIFFLCRIYIHVSKFSVDYSLSK